ncbi:MAG: hypothetical protein AAGJ40_04195 [Planctomycetota bacterium]
MGVHISLFQIVAPGVKCVADSFVIQRYRKVDSNLRTTFDRILECAGVKRFAEPFNDSQPSAWTEKERSGRYANHALNDWFGHSEEVAKTYYLQTTEDDDTEAIREAGRPADGVVGTSVGEQDASQGISANKKPRKSRALTVGDGYRGSHQYTPEDSNL